MLLPTEDFFCFTLQIWMGVKWIFRLFLRLYAPSIRSRGGTKMSVLTESEKKIIPSVFFRNKIPMKYSNSLNEICSQVIVDPWGYGEPEPEMSFDISQCNVLFTLGIQDNLKILKKAPNIKWIHSYSVGIDAMLHEEVRNSDIIITNSKGCTSVPIAEHTIAMITAFSRGVTTMFKNQMERKWELIPVKDLTYSTVGIIGYGAIGVEIAKRCKAFGMRVIGCRRRPNKQLDEPDYADVIVGMDRVDEVLSQSDFLVLALPSTKDTLSFLNKEKLAIIKKGSFLINVGRGNTVVEADLIASLQNGHIAGAALDVFEVEPLPKEHPFWTLENVIVSPHNAYYSPNNFDRIMELFIRNLQLFSEGRPLMNVVDKQLGY